MIIKATLIMLILLNAQYKTIVKIESCANSGRCRVIFDDNSTDLVFNPHVGQKFKKGT